MSRWATWTAWMDRREDALPLALLRILLGLVLAGHLAHLVWVDAPGLVWVDSAYGGMRSISHPTLARIGGATPETIGMLVNATIATSLLMAVGILTRLFTGLTWLGFGILGDLNGQAGGSYDELIQCALLLLTLSGCGGRLSLDARWGLARSEIPAWPRYVLVCQLVVMYFATGIQKVSAHWVPWGSLDALWYIFQQPTWQRIPMTWLWPAYPLTRLATIGSWLFEVGSPLLLLALYARATRTRGGWWRHTLNRLDWRGTVLLIGVAMHIGIEAAMEVGPFCPATVSLYLACFHPDELRRWPLLRTLR